MRTVTISKTYSYIIGSPEEHIRQLRDKATDDATDRFCAASKEAIRHYYGRGPEEFSEDRKPFAVFKMRGVEAWQIIDKQTSDLIFGSAPCRVGSNDIEIQSLEDAAPRVQRTIYICQDYTTCVPE